MQTVLAIREQVKAAAAQRRALSPVGGGTMLDFGLPPARPATRLDLARLDQVVDYPARDMTITVQAGITAARLQEILAAEGQRLPVDVPCPEQATLGGAVAANASGPRRLGFGTFRDYVIGITAINDRGEEVKAGGRVVKNVAGYDLCKLHIGALGTLGIITQLTLKVRPLPEESVLLAFACPAGRLAEALELVHESRTRPAAIDAISPEAGAAMAAAHTTSQAATGDWLLLIGFEENRAATAWQVRSLELPAKGFTKLGQWTEREADRRWAWLRDFPLMPPARVTFKASLLPSRTAAFLLAAQRFSGLLQAHAGNGVVVGHLPSVLDLEAARRAVASLRAAAVEAGGSLVLSRCPPDWQPVLGVWGPPRGDAWLMREVKRQLDPLGIFNPGKFGDWME